MNTVFTCTSKKRGAVLPRAALLVLTFVAISCLGWQFWTLHTEMQRIHDRDYRLAKLTGEIIHLDEVLTMSARMAAATLDPAWEDRYRRFEPELDDAIKECLHLEPGMTGDFVAQTDSANRKLVEMEKGAFESVRKKDQRAATAILFSPEYENQKQLYADGMRKLIVSLETRAQATMAAQQRRIPLVFAALLVVLAVLSLSWLALLRASRRRAEAERQARQATEQARDELETRVAEATANLTLANRRLEEEMEVRRGSEEAVRESESRLSAITDSARDAILMMDPEGLISYWNPAAERIFGYTSAEAIGRDLHDLIVPKRYHEAHRAAFPEFRLTGQGAAVGKTLELEASRKDGQEIAVALSLSSVQIKGRWHAVGILRDITDSKQAAEIQARLVAILDATPDFVGFADAKDTHIVYINPAGRNMTGVGAQEDVTHLKIGDVHPEWTNKLFRDKIIPTAIRDGVWTGECAFLNRDGREVPVMMVLVAHKSPSGEVERFSTISRDITDRKQAEEALRAKTGELEQANSRLETAIERANQMAVEAQSANIAKSQFLANMSHEIRTPMNGVIGMTGLLLDTDLSEEQRRYAEVVRSSGEALLRVINDILDFSKIEADKLELEALDFDLRTMLEDTAELLAVHAHEKNLEFICRFDPQLPTFLRGDPGRLRQILVNLGGNAIKFTSRGEVAIEARLESETDGHIKARFEVRDTGIGIPQDKIGLLFTAFQQVDASTTRRFGGTGLGLAVSKRLVELMGGEVGMESVEGRGSSFWFTAVLDKQPPRERGDAAPRADVRGARVLIVDDNATNRLVLAEQLASWGVRHAETGSAAAAMDVLRAARAQGDPFRIVLTDMQMPEMDGESLGRAVKADPELRDTLLVMMTSLGRRGDAKRLEAIGFSAYLTKPVKQSKLYDCLATVLGGGAPPVKAPEAALVTRHTLSEDRRRKVRILLAEDNPTNQQVALRILEKMGFRADAVANGQEAIQALKMAPYDIVFMDVQMPVMDGFEATRQIRDPQSAVRNHQIPIVAMTAHAMKGDRERCLEAGMDDYVPKPISPQTLASALEKWLDRAQEQPPAVPAPPGETEPSEEPPVFDRQALRDRLMGDEELVREIIAGFLEDMPKQMRRLREHVGQGQAGLAGGQAHAIRSAAGNVGGMALSAAAFEIEKAGNKDQLERIAALMPELQRQFDRLEAQMREDES